MTLTTENTKFIKDAVKEWKLLQKGRDWRSWMMIGSALELLSREAMERIGSNRREGRGYNTAFSKICKEAGFGNPEIDPKVRSHLLYLLDPEHRLICDDLRNAMTSDDRMRIQHPSTMYKKVKTYIQKRDGEQPRQKTPSQRQHELEQQLAQVEELLAGADIDPEAVTLHWLSLASVGDAARMLLAIGREKVILVIEVAAQQLKDETEFGSEDQE